jgi:hypothetical protein
VAAGSTFTLGNSGTYTQTAGTTTIDGTFMSTVATSALNLNGGSLFGTGTLGFGVVDAGTLTPADSLTAAGKLAVSGNYQQNFPGVLNIAIGGLTAGTQYDQLNVTGTANVNGTVNLSLINGFVPTIGTTFDILTGSSVAGNFSTVNGMHINGSEHFAVACDPTDCDVTVMNGASPAAASITATTAPGRQSSQGRGSLNLNSRPSSMPAISAAKNQGVDALPGSTRESSQILITDGTCGGLRTFGSIFCMTTAISDVTHSTRIPSAQSQGTESKATESKARREGIATASTMRSSGGGGSSRTPGEPATSAAEARLSFCAFVPSSLSRTMGCR